MATKNFNLIKKKPKVKLIGINNNIKIIIKLCFLTMQLIKIKYKSKIQTVFSLINNKINIKITVFSRKTHNYKIINNKQYSFNNNKTNN